MESDPIRNKTVRFNKCRIRVAHREAMGIKCNGGLFIYMFLFVLIFKSF